jgi:hypothetical protein
MVWANGELVPISSLVGTTCEVFDKHGAVRQAEFKSFGVQSLKKITFGPVHQSHLRFDVEATANHRWFTSNRGEVTDLRVGDRVTISPRFHDQESDAYKAGFVHGIVFGDGCKTTGREKYYQIRLCGKKMQYLDQLTESEHYLTHCFPPSYNGDAHVRFRTGLSMKDLPHGESIEYNAGFLAGWIAADGCFSKGRQVLHCGDKLALDWVVENNGIIGYCVTGFQKLNNSVTNYGPRNKQICMISLSKSDIPYRVISMEDGPTEEVFCAIEPVTKSFTLGYGLPTGNCHTVQVRSVNDWVFGANMLMLGGGVGFSLLEIDDLPTVSSKPCKLTIRCKDSHPDLHEFKSSLYDGPPTNAMSVECADTREGWVTTMGIVLKCAFEGEDIDVDVSPVRPRGSKVVTFGGIAPGPGPLVKLLTNVFKIVRSAAGRKLTTVNGLDVSNYIGLCIESGGIRRSAEIVLADPFDVEFRHAKRDYELLKSHRHCSNNSIAFESDGQFRDFDWKELVDDVATYGEPGLVNLWLARKSENSVVGVNPCSEFFLENREACNVSEYWPSLDVRRYNVPKLVTRYTMRQRLVEQSDPIANATRIKNMRIGVSLGGVTDWVAGPDDYSLLYSKIKNETISYAQELGVNVPIKCTTIVPSGTKSAIVGSGSGMHSHHSPFYIRRTTIMKNEPIAQSLIEAGVPYEQSKYGDTVNKLVFEFPIAAPKNSTSFGVSETITDQWKRQKDLQMYYADNAVSATLSFNEGEKETLSKLLERDFQHYIKSTSMLPRAHGFEQAPFEQIDEDEFNRRYVKINHSHPLAGGDIEVEACENGACPIR